MSINAVASSSAIGNRQPTSPELSKETVDTESSDDDSVDSEGDIDAVQPRRQRQPEEEAPAASARSSKFSKFLPKYTPPAGMSPLGVSTSFSSSPFEWDAMNKPGLELWCIRAPKDLKASRLSGLSVSTRHGVKGSLRTKHHAYSLVSAGTVGKSHELVDQDGRHPTAGPGLVDAMAMDIDASERRLRAEGGEEMGGGMRLLVPRIQQGGKLFVAPIPIKHHLLLTPETLPHPTTHDDDPLPSFLSTSIPRTTQSEATLHPELMLPPKRAQPIHLMKFRNKAYGFDTPGPEAVAAEPEKRKAKAVDSPRKKSKKA